MTPEERWKVTFCATKWSYMNDEGFNTSIKDVFGCRAPVWVLQQHCHFSLLEDVEEMKDKIRLHWSVHFLAWLRLGIKGSSFLLQDFWTSTEIENWKSRSGDCNTYCFCRLWVFFVCFCVCFFLVIFWAVYSVN